MKIKVARTIAEMRKLRRCQRGSVGLLPTMGCLHKGHMALVRRAREENSAVVVSIFVNPSQFVAGEDFDTYPRDLDRDLALLEQEQVDIVFAPSTEDMYPPGFSTWVDVEKVTERLEGASRPGHFRGVATVCARLFNIVQPTRAYFGQKDAQQAVVIKRMVADLAMDLEIVLLPTVRESDGLAVSSRNGYLDPRERRAATVLFASLSLARKLWKDGEKDAGKIRQQMTDLIRREPLAQMDYVSIADTNTLEELAAIDRAALVSLAVRIGRTRLIDNIVLARVY